MYTSAEMTMLQMADNNAVLPGIGTLTGNQTPISTMTGLAGLPTSYGDYWYSAATNIVYVRGAGAVLNGINFGSATVQIMANNVTVENCTFTATTGYYSLTQNGYSGAIVQNCTFNGNQIAGTIFGTFIQSNSSSILVQNNSFLNAPKDAVDLEGGTVIGNYISGEGYNVGLHPDAIWVTNTLGPVLISGNFIDYTPNANSTNPPNDCIRITDELGPVSNVTVTGNYLLGGSSGIDAGNGGGTDYSNINISGNYIGFGINFTYAPGPEVGVTATNNIVFDFTNPAYSQAAWAAYQKSGLFANGLVTATASTTSLSASNVQTTTLNGNGYVIHMYGSSQETIFVGGAGTQYMTGGSGEDIFSYLAISDSTLHNPDLISLNPTQDVIDLHSINANITGPQVNFTFIGSAAFSSAGGEVRVVQDVANNQTLVEADLVGDSSIDLEIRVAGLVKLTAANFALTTSQFIAATAQNTTMATFLSSQTLLDQVTGGYSIYDTGANVSANLNKLSADRSHIDSISLTSGNCVASIVSFFQNFGLIEKISNGVVVTDTAANVASRIDGLSNDQFVIASINIGGSAAAPAILQVTAAQAISDSNIFYDFSSPLIVQSTNADGSISDTGYANGMTFAVAAGNHYDTGGGTNEAFVLAPQFGQATITDFNLYDTDPVQHDTIQLSKTDFANWASLIGSAHVSGAANADTTFTAQDGASLTIQGVTVSAFQHAGAQLQADFKFV